ncbi:MAG: ATP-binding protein [Acidimicrobiia bacterium]
MTSSITDPATGHEGRPPRQRLTQREGGAARADRFRRYRALLAEHRPPEPERPARQGVSGLMSRLRPSNMGVRARITITFAVGAFFLSMLLAGSTYLATRQTIVRQREKSVNGQVRVNAAYVRNVLRSANPEVIKLLQSLQTPGGAKPLVLYKGQWTPLSAQFGDDVLPKELKDRVVTDGRAAQMRFSFDGDPQLAVGIPLPDVEASYFEIVTQAELESTLRSVAAALIAGAALTTALGVVVGVGAARRAVRPLAQAARAAEAIAGGRLDTRLEPMEDPDLGQLANAFNNMASALQERVDRDARFASDVSHELRSPLMTLSASIEVIQSRRSEMPERAVAALDLLTADVARFQGLVEDLLEISRFDAGSVRLHFEDIDVAEFVRQAVAYSNDPDVPVVVAPEAVDTVIRADKRRLARVIANLIENARHYGEGATSVVIDVPPDGGSPPAYVWIAVEDNGPGVPAEERSLIFQRFARGSSAGRRGSGEGAGLGLALVDEHVRLHAGRIWVDDRPDGASGARFVIALPTVTP